VGGLTLGVLNLTNRSSGKRFVATHLEEGMRLAQQASQALNNSRLYHLAILEPTTQVFHRAHLYHRVEDEIVRARRYQRHVSLIAVRLNEIDDIRKSRGHELGNLLELEFADLLKRSIRETDAVGRLGDGSFAVLLPETDSLGAMFLAERIHQEAESFGSLAELSVTTGLGVCSFPDRADNAQRLFARAESAMDTACRSKSELPVYLVPALGAEVESSRYNTMAVRLARAI
jgi:diguanylate cyclase (GGDEF)-like protein